MTAEREQNMAVTHLGTSKLLRIAPLMGLPAWLVRSILIAVIAGAMLFVFGWSSSVSAQGGTTHIVQSGENLSTIARRYGVSLDALARHNGIVNMNLVSVGQSLRIPATASSSAVSSSPAQIRPDNDSPAPVETRSYRAETPGPSPSTTSVIYTVHRGDSLFGIARRFHVSVEALKLRNGLQGDFIRVGQRLIIP
jgi:LysM repeat protein